VFWNVSSSMSSFVYVQYLIKTKLICETVTSMSSECTFLFLFLN
jgi:hypothetical protein